MNVGITPEPIPSPAVRDRSLWVILLGVLEIAVGLLVVFLIAVSAVTASPLGAGLRPGPPPDSRAMVSSFTINLVLATLFIWNGIATLRFRRWARALMLSVAWLWLIVGVVAFVLLLVSLPGLRLLLTISAGDAISPLAVALVVAFVVAVLTILYVLLPAAFVLVLRDPSVRAAFERRDPEPSWTDRCAGPVLSMILTLAYAGLTFLAALPFGIAPFFGRIVSGAAAAALWIASAGASAWLAWAFVQSRREAWWGTLAVTVLWTVSAVLTLVRVDATEIFRAAGVPAEQVEILQIMGLAGSTTLGWMTALTGGSVVAYLIYLRRFVPAGRRGAVSD